MRGFFEWFKSNTKIKRWIFLILIGIILACYGISQLLILQEMSFIQLGKIVLCFVIGFTFVIVGIIYIQKRTLELMIEISDNRSKEGNVNVKSLIFNKNVYDKGPKIVAIGGGTGLNVVLEGIKNFTNNITAIVTLSDYGTSTRSSLGLLPFEDVKDSIISLSNNKDDMSNLLNYKFNQPALKNINFGDIYFSALGNISNNVAEAVSKSSNVLNIIGKVLPVTLDEINICTELEDGTIIEEKNKIKEVILNKVTKINRVYITPSNCKVSPGVIDTILSADAIILGPGSLYTNVIPNLLVKGVAKAIKESKAMKIYVSNLMTEPGQTDNYSLSDHINAIEEHVGKGLIDYCVCDYGEIVPEFVKKYNKNGADLVELDINKVKEKDVKILQRKISIVKGEYIRHNSNTLAETIIELICDELKFKDKINDPEYVMLNTRLKQEKRKKKILKKKTEEKKDKNNKKQVKDNKSEVKHKKEKVKSKFNKKYNERIESIKNTEKNKLENIKLANEKEKITLDKK